MKKKIFLLPCIAAVAIATFVGAKTFKSNAIESDDLLMANVEAMADGESREVIEVDCYAKLSDVWFAYGNVLKCPEGTFIGESAYPSGHRYTCGKTRGSRFPGTASSKCYEIK